MNVLFVTNSIGYGGAEKMMSFVANYLSKKKYTIIILNLNAVPNYVNRYTQKFDNNIKIITLDKANYNKHVFCIRHIISTIRKFHIDVIVAFTMFPNFYAKIASLFTGVPSIMSERGDPYITFTKSLKDRIIYWVITASKGGVFQTKEASLFYTKNLRKRSKVIPNPIEGVEIPSVLIQNRQKTVVSVGRFKNVQKRYDIMLKAFWKFSQCHSDYILKLYGSGEDENLIREWVDKLNLSDKVVFMGVIKNPMNYIYNDGIFIITSDYEGIPNALLEAMAVGLPVVTTDCSPGGARLLVQNGENGQIVPLADVDAIANALARYVEDAGFAAHCGNNARRVLQTYSPSVIGDLWVSYIKKIANKE